MAASNLIALIDDIATVLDDVAIISKVAAKKTAGVLADDLALNAEQVSGVKAERELPVVWAVAKGSFLNKLILVPAALLISAFLPWLIIVLLMVGGAYLCFEGVEKLLHSWLHKQEQEAHQAELLNVLTNPKADLVTFEQQKIAGAIRTDFILSAEIIVIMLGTMQGVALSQQIVSLSLLAIGFTLFVYGLVAVIVKLDDLGLYLLRDAQGSTIKPVKRVIGRGLLQFAPLLMKSLSVLGTVAMFLVGGGIIVHAIPMLHYGVETLVGSIQLGESFAALSWLVTIIIPAIINLLVGIMVGGVAVALVKGVEKLFRKNPSQQLN